MTEERQKPYGTLKPTDFNRLSNFIYKEFGIRIPEKKHYLLQNRLVKRLQLLDMRDYSEYADYVLSGIHSGDEVFRMIDVISTNKTDFFREKRHFDFLTKILPEEFNGVSMHAWSAGCSTGQEVYSLAMIFDEMREQHVLKDYVVYGNDVSSRVLDQARLAVYPFKESVAVPENYRRKYLLKSKNKKDARIRVVPAIREKTRFVWMNLADEQYKMPYDFHVIFCRNTLIYFDLPMQQKVINTLTRHLMPGGYLFVGHSEALINMDISGLKLIRPAIYQKTENYE